MANFINSVRGFMSGLRPATKADIEKATDKIIMKLSDLQAKLDALKVQLDKTKAEILAEVENLKKQLADVELPEGATASLEALTGKVQELDDLNPDAAPTPEPTPATEAPPNP